MKALVIDEHSLVRHGLEMLLTGHLGFLDVLHAESCEQALLFLQQHKAIDIVFLSDELGDEERPRVLMRLKSKFPETPIVMISGAESPDSTEHTLSNGAQGFLFLPKHLAVHQLITAIRAVLSGQVCIPSVSSDEQNNSLAMEAAQTMHSTQGEGVSTSLSDTSEKQLESVIDDLLQEHSLGTSRLDTLALSDDLTGVANRRLFVERTQCALKNARRRKNLMALICLHFNEFNSMSAKYGDTVGDTVLVEVSRRLCKTLREVDTVARIGRAEFGVVLVDIESRDGVRDAAERVHRVLLKPLELPGVLQWDAGLCMGVVVSRGDEMFRDLLLRVGELLRRVRGTGTNQYIID